ncbi:MAG: four-carbon acid sugar kinase family protein [Chloroflexi bacterium]|nr:four-carbon acid sugar kinase family protein [Chloroflexota bacterium]
MNESTTPLVGIFADDLTGALDAAAPFAARGFRTLVSPTSELPVGAEGAEVISVNLGTRHLDPRAIAERTHQAVIELGKLGVKILLNKIDSTLRGNPGIELLAAINAVSGDHAVLCSAYPQNLRTIADGVLLVDGIPVVDTDVGQDKLSPLLSSRVVEILASSLERAGLADRVHVRGADNGMAVTDLLPVIISLDARTEDDLSGLARRLVNTGSTTLVAGSAGISIAIADELSTRWQPRRASQEDDVWGRRILIVTASQRSVVYEQVAVLGGSVDLIHAEVSVDEAFDGITTDSIRRISELIKQDGVAVLKLEKVNPSGELGIDELRLLAKRIILNLGIAVRKITDAANPNTLIVIGGDTTSGVLSACDVTTLELRGELQPGTVIGVSVDGSLTRTCLITRAGGFGDENSLLDLVTLLEFGHSV